VDESDEWEECGRCEKMRMKTRRMKSERRGCNGEEIDAGV